MGKQGIIYVATNPAMMCLLKFGKTDRDCPAIRLRELFSTGVPIAFDCAYAAVVDNNTEVENYLANRYVKRRLLPNREFYLLTVPTAIKAIKPFEVENVTLTTRKEIDALLTDKQRADRKAAREMLQKVYPDAVTSRNAHLTIRSDK